MKGIPVNSGDAFFVFTYATFIFCNYQANSGISVSNIITPAYP